MAPPGGSRSVDPRGQPPKNKNAKAQRRWWGTPDMTLEAILDHMLRS
jgi:hypothetical protein